MLVAFGINAQPGPGPEFQNKKEKRELLKDLSPQQRAELRTKQMTLDLDLTKAQQEKILQWNLENENKRETMKQEREAAKELTKDQLFELKKAHLDYEIAMKQKLKSILTEEQMAKFEKKREHHPGKKGAMKKQPRG